MPFGGPFIGMSERQVMLIFLTESALFGLIGSLIGVGMFSLFKYALTVNPVNLPVGTLVPILGTDAVLQAIALIVGASVVAGYFPALMASRQEILETIKTVE